MFRHHPDPSSCHWRGVGGGILRRKVATLFRRLGSEKVAPTGQLGRVRDVEVMKNC